MSEQKKAVDIEWLDYSILEPVVASKSTYYQLYVVRF